MAKNAREQQPIRPQTGPKEDLDLLESLFSANQTIERKRADRDEVKAKLALVKGELSEAEGDVHAAEARRNALLQYVNGYIPARRDNLTATERQAEADAKAQSLFEQLGQDAIAAEAEKLAQSKVVDLFKLPDAMKPGEPTPPDESESE